MDHPELGRYGHHPDPSTDFCIEVDCCEGLLADVNADLATYDDVSHRFVMANDFRVGGDQYAIAAKAALRRATDQLQRFAPKL